MFTCTHACPHRRSLPFAHFARGTGTTSPVLGEGRRESGCLEPAPRWVPIFLNSKPPTPWTPPSSPQPMPPHSDAQAARGASSIWGSSQAGRPGGREPPSLETRPQVSGTRAGAAGGGGESSQRGWRFLLIINVRQLAPTRHQHPPLLLQVSLWFPPA